VIRVLLVDDEVLVRAGLRMIIETSDDMEVVGEADDGATAVDAVTRRRPDVVLMDIRMPRLDGVSATSAVRALDAAPAVVVLTTFDTDDNVFAALEAGATGFLLKDTPPRELLQAVRIAASGDAVLAPSVARRVVERQASSTRERLRREAQRAVERLTDREREVLVAVGEGRSNAEIARHLHMSEATVKSHIGHLFDKLGIDNRVQVAITAHRAGLVD